MGEEIIIAVLSLLFLPVVVVVLLAITLASCGKSIGIRRAYVALLLRIFEACKVKVPVSNYTDALDNENDKDDNKDGKEYKQQDSYEEDHIIEKHYLLSATKGIEKPQLPISTREFNLSDICYFSKCGMEAIIEDTVTKRFSAEELPAWNLLTRTHKPYQFMSLRLTVLWCIGFIARYMILLPFRSLVASFGIIMLIISTGFIGHLKEGRLKQKLNRWANLMCFRILCRAFSCVIRFHNRENMTRSGICVANHTSPIDVCILSCDNCYAMIGQTHRGLLGVLQRSLGRATAHIWFDRSEAKDRSLVARRLKSHIEDKNKLPILIFPEGTCINNTSVMMFKKGSFEVSDTIYPVAIKYDPRFGDAFWNSSRQSWAQHLLEIMTSWALVCDVWYMPAMTRLENEDAVAFANRVKSQIASRGGLVELDWDGGLKRAFVKESMKEVTQEQYSKILKVE